MILLNTTFACDPQLEVEVARWITDTYLKAARMNRSFSRFVVSKVFPLPDADASSIAVQMQCSSVGEANAWLQGTGAELTNALTSGRSDRIMTFATLMEIMYDGD